MKIVPFSAEHIPQAATIIAELFSKPPWNYPYTDYTVGKRLDYLYSLPDSKGYICFDDEGEMAGVLLGYVECRGAEDGFHLVECSVNEKHQRSGVGSKLLETLDNFLKERDVKSIYLETFKDTYISEFYEKNGFKIHSKACVMYKVVK